MVAEEDHRAVAQPRAGPRRARCRRGAVLAAEILEVVAARAARDARVLAGDSRRRERRRWPHGQPVRPPAETSSSPTICSRVRAGSPGDSALPDTSSTARSLSPGESGDWTAVSVRSRGIVIGETIIGRPGGARSASVAGEAGQRGATDVSVAPSPSWPVVSAPQQLTCRRRGARRCGRRPRRSRRRGQARRPGRDVAEAVVPLPSWPLSFAPQHQTLPSPRSRSCGAAGRDGARGRGAPASARPAASCAPRPSCPSAPRPQHQTRAARRRRRCGRRPRDRDRPGAPATERHRRGMGCSSPGAVAELSLVAAPPAPGGRRVDGAGVPAPAVSGVGAGQLTHRAGADQAVVPSPSCPSTLSRSSGRRRRRDDAGVGRAGRDRVGRRRPPGRRVGRRA